jgi:hypothetical protein
MLSNAARNDGGRGGSSLSPSCGVAHDNVTRTASQRVEIRIAFG